MAVKKVVKRMKKINSPKGQQKKTDASVKVIDLPKKILNKDVGTLGDISFYVNEIFGKKKMLGLSDIAITSSAKFEEHSRNGKKSLLEFTGPGLDSLSFNVYASAQYGVNPLKIKKSLENYMKKGTPNYFVLCGKKIGDNRWVITNIQSDFTVIFVDGRPAEITFSLQLQEYVNPVSSSNKKKTSKKNTKKTISDKTVKKTSYIKYVIKKHDTLWKLAVKFYKDGTKYMKIYNANKKATKGFDKIANPNKLDEGLTIKIPK